MYHPEIFILPVLMIADYYLTIWGAVLREKEYGRHFVIETYEMNPHYRKDIDSKSLLNIRFIGQVILNFLILFLCSVVFSGTYEFIYWVVLGFYLTLFGYIIGLHVSNILSFRFANRNTDVFDGAVNIAHRYSLRSSLYSNFVVLIPLLFVLLFSFSYFAAGSVIAMLYNILLGFIWIVRANRSKTKDT